MSFFTRKAEWFAAVTLCAALLTAQMVSAETVDAEAQAAATEAAHEAEEAEHGGETAGDPNPLAFRTDLAIWTFVVFVLLFTFLSIFAWPQIAAALDERERKITDNIAAAEARLEEAKRIVAEHEARLAAAAGEVRALLEEARRDADHTRKSIEAKGHQAAKDELDRALREIGRAKDGAIQELAEKSANTVIDLAREIIRDEISAERREQIVREALGKLSAATPSRN
ncbi:MAG: F0F1 ATP synthase subunit B [Planctomycetes bacterium]|nr:F0F1 ATP synthase subunit B [Planctomycetota bacterium]